MARTIESKHKSKSNSTNQLFKCHRQTTSSGTSPSKTSIVETVNHQGVLKCTSYWKARFLHPARRLWKRRQLLRTIVFNDSKSKDPSPNQIESGTEAVCWWAGGEGWHPIQGDWVTDIASESCLRKDRTGAIILILWFFYVIFKFQKINSLIKNKNLKIIINLFS